MSFFCDPPCTSTFATAAARDQHKADAPKHAGDGIARLASGFDDIFIMVDKATHGQNGQHAPQPQTPFSCAHCKKSFGSQAALRQHTQNSPFHQEQLSCTPCNKTFGSESALNAHLSDSPHHRKKLVCAACSKKFQHQKGLDAHISDKHKGQADVNRVKEVANLAKIRAASAAAAVAPAPAPSTPALGLLAFACMPCDRRFGSQSALDAHINDSPKHAPATPSKRQSPGSSGSLNTRSIGTPGTSVCFSDSVASAAANTPLDLFFRSFGNFPYDPKLSPEKSFRRLETYFGWEKRSGPQMAAWRDYQDALVEEVRLWFGSESDIQAWHCLCKAIGIKTPPAEVKKCETMVRRTHVNIVDLVTWSRTGSHDDNTVTVYSSVDELRQYTRETGKIFPKDDMFSSDGERNIVLRHLLRQIFTPNKKTAW